MSGFGRSPLFFYLYKNLTPMDTMQTKRPDPTPEHAATEHATPEGRLTRFLEETLAPLGYELVALEVNPHREKKLCLFIDLLEESGAGVGIEDCVRVTQALDGPLEGNAELEMLFKGPYELEVSSPGIDRPLRKPSHFEHYQGEVARLNTFRPLTGEETQAPDYSAKNPKQKHFYGILRGFERETGSILFGIIPEDGTRAVFKNKKSKSPKPATPRPETLIRVPLELVAKANLEPLIEIPENK
jgi:ribosome maturation factor RimP